MGVRENHCGGYLSCPSWNRDRRCTMLQARIDRAERRGGTTRFHSCDRLRSSRDGYASISTLRIIGRRWILYVTRINLARSSASAYNLAIVSEVETNFKRKILYSYRSSYQRKYPFEQLISIQNISKKESSKIRIIFTGEKKSINRKFSRKLILFLDERIELNLVQFIAKIDDFTVCLSWRAT